MTTEVRYLQVTENEIYQRLDNYLLKHLKGVPKTRIYRAIRKGEVRVNKKRCKASTRLEARDEVRIPPIRTSDPKKISQPTAYIEKLLKSSIVYEDDDLLVMNKPENMSVHAGTGITAGLIEKLRLIFPSMDLELAHRLDRGTSGCLIITKNAVVLRELQQMMRKNEVKKVYSALVSGRWPEDKTKVSLPLRKYQPISGERMVVVDAIEGREAITLIKPVEYYDKMTLIEATLVTGRTHQIRVHCAQSGHAIVGDEKYGDKQINNSMRKQGFKRMFLHAARLEFKHPRTGEQLIVKTDPGFPIF